MAKYELLVDVMPMYELEKDDNGKPKPFGRIVKRTIYRKGDTFELDDERAERLQARGVVAKPGELQRRKVEAMKAEAARLMQESKAAEAKAKDTEKGAKAEQSDEKAEAGK